MISLFMAMMGSAETKVLMASFHGIMVTKPPTEEYKHDKSKKYEIYNSSSTHPVSYI